MNIQQDYVDERQGAMIIDFAVKSGTANIYTEQSNDRAAYVGNKHFISLLLDSEQIYTCGEQITAIYLHCEYPVHVTFTNKLGNVIEQDIQQAWVCDSELSSLTIQNKSENKNAIVLCYV